MRYLRFHVRYYLPKLQADLYARGVVREAAVGAGRIWTVRAGAPRALDVPRLTQLREI